MNSNMVSTQSPPIEIRASSAAERSSSASESGSAKGRATSAPIVASQKSPAKVLATTRSGSSPSS